MLEFEEGKNRDELCCPYCGYEWRDSYEWGSNSLEYYDTETCDECGKTFHASRRIAIWYESAKDCELNNTPHNFEPYYKNLFKCSECGKTELQGDAK